MYKSGRNFSCDPTKSQMQADVERSAQMTCANSYCICDCRSHLSFEHHFMLPTATKLKRETSRQSWPTSGRATVQSNDRWWFACFIACLWHVVGAHLRRNWHCPLVTREQEMKAMLSVVIKVNLASTANWLTNCLTNGARTSLVALDALSAATRNHFVAANDVVSG